MLAAGQKELLTVSGITLFISRPLRACVSLQVITFGSVPSSITFGISFFTVLPIMAKSGPLEIVPKEAARELTEGAAMRI